MVGERVDFNLGKVALEVGPFRAKRIAPAVPLLHLPFVILKAELEQERC